MNIGKMANEDLEKHNMSTLFSYREAWRLGFIKAAELLNQNECTVCGKSIDMKSDVHFECVSNDG